MKSLLELKAQDYNKEKMKSYGLECDKCYNIGEKKGWNEL